MSIWTVDGQMRGIGYTGSADQLRTLAEYRKGESDLDSDTVGVDAYKRPTLPRLTVTGRFRARRLVEVRSAVAEDTGTRR
ncbi:hypothetical protein ACFWFF_14300 [Streptomyces sp. NPDC060223]|uniref:hypothetical protein n=1 Tax=unclassified Streptomyces TaxID=2593676 RepID=UPI00362ACF88